MKREKEKKRGEKKNRERGKLIERDSEKEKKKGGKLRKKSYESTHIRRLNFFYNLKFKSGLKFQLQY